MYTCSVMIGADEHVADSPYPVLSLHAHRSSITWLNSNIFHSDACVIFPSCRLKFSLDDHFPDVVKSRARGIALR